MADNGMIRGQSSGPKRGEDQRERDLEIIAALYLSGFYQYQIPAELQRRTGAQYVISQQQVSNDLALIRSRWRESAVLDFNEKRMQEVDRIDTLEREAWAAWRKSQEPVLVKFAERSHSRKDGSKRRTFRKSEQRAGEPAFLRVIQTCITQRCQLLGIIGEDMQAGLNRDDLNLDLDERARRASVLLLTAIRRRDGVEPMPTLASEQPQ
jgi:hypothetical protein